MKTGSRDLRGIIEGLSAEELRALLSALEGRVVDVGEYPNLSNIHLSNISLSLTSRP